MDTSRGCRCVNLSTAPHGGRFYLRDISFVLKTSTATQLNRHIAPWTFQVVFTTNWFFCIEETFYCFLTYSSLIFFNMKSPSITDIKKNWLGLFLMGFVFIGLATFQMWPSCSIPLSSFETLVVFLGQCKEYFTGSIDYFKKVQKVMHYQLSAFCNASVVFSTIYRVYQSITEKNNSKIQKISLRIWNFYLHMTIMKYPLLLHHGLIICDN